MNIENLKNGLKGLIKDDTTTETAESVGALLNQLEEVKKDYDSLLQSKEELRLKYIDAIKNNSFLGEPGKVIQNNKPKSFEDCVKDAIKNN